jgi:hypothetical protein
LSPLAIVATCGALLTGCERAEATMDAPRLSDLTRGAPRAKDSKPPAIAVQPRKGALEDKGSYPCAECHDESLPNDPRERELTEAHEDIKLVHGAGRLWCTTCHHDDRGQLKSLKGAPIDFDESFVLCGECHFRQLDDFIAGAHGKRIGNWNANTPRTVMACTGCHDAHDPSIKPHLPWRSGRMRGVDAG